MAFSVTGISPTNYKVKKSDTVGYSLTVSDSLSSTSKNNSPSPSVVGITYAATDLTYVNDDLYYLLDNSISGLDYPASYNSIIQSTGLPTQLSLVGSAGNKLYIVGTNGTLYEYQSASGIWAVAYSSVPATFDRVLTIGSSLLFIVDNPGRYYKYNPSTNTFSGPYSIGFPSGTGVIGTPVVRSARSYASNKVLLEIYYENPDPLTVLSTQRESIDVISINTDTLAATRLLSLDTYTMRTTYGHYYNSGDVNVIGTNWYLSLWDYYSRDGGGNITDGRLKVHTFSGGISSSGKIMSDIGSDIKYWEGQIDTNGTSSIDLGTQYVGSFVVNDELYLGSQDLSYTLGVSPPYTPSYNTSHINQTTYVLNLHKLDKTSNAFGLGGVTDTSAYALFDSLNSVTFTNGSSSSRSKYSSTAIGTSKSSISIGDPHNLSYAYVYEFSPSTNSIEWDNTGSGSFQYETTTALTNNYTAPATTGSETVRARALGDVSWTSTTVYIVDPTIAIDALSTVYPSDTVNVSSTGSVDGDPGSSWTINWYLNGVLQGTSTLSGGTTSFNFSAPSSAGSYTLKAEFASYTYEYDQKTLTVNAPSISISGSTSILPFDTNRAFTATGNGVGDTVTWSVAQVMGAYTPTNYSTVETVSSSTTDITLKTHFVANTPDSGTAFGYLRITATSTEDPTATGQSVVPLPGYLYLIIAPETDVDVYQGESFAITTELRDGFIVDPIPSAYLTYSWSDPSKGSVSPSNTANTTFTADLGVASGNTTATLSATYTATGAPVANVTGTYTIVPINIYVSGTTSVDQGDSVTLTANVTGIVAPNNIVSWGIISGHGSLGVPSGSTIDFTADHGVGTSGPTVIRATSDYDVLSYGEITVTTAIPTVTLVVNTAGPFDQKDVNKQPYTATVTGTTYDTLTWSVVEVAFATYNGTVNASSGLITQIPYGTSSNGTYTVKATLDDYSDNSIYDTDTFIVNPVTVTLSPATKISDQAASVAAFTATVTGIVEASKTVTWTVDGAAFATNGGTINAGTGAITAPYQNAAEGTYVIRATNTTDTNGTGTASLIVNPISVSVSPSTDTLDQAEIATPFTATVTGTTRITQITWTVETNGAAWTDRNGSITSPSGLITAPYGWNDPLDAANTYQIKATHNDDVTKSATANLTIRPITISLSPKPGNSIDQKDSASVTAVTIGGTTRTGVTWTVTDAGVTNPTASFIGLGGAIVAATGVVTAAYSQGALAVQRAEGNWTINVVHDDDSRKTDTTTFSINEVVTTINQGNLSRVSQEDSSTFTITVTGSTETDVTWAIEENPAGGLIVDVANDGVYTAPAQEGQYHITATHANDPLAVDRILVVVPPVRVSLIPSIVEMDQSSTKRFSARVINHSDKTVSWTATGAAAAAPSDATDKWYKISTGIIRRFASSVVYDNKIWILGGATPGTLSIPDLTIYDIPTKTWMKGKPFDLGTGISGHKACVYGSKMYFYGGSDEYPTTSMNITSNLYSYDFEKDIYEIVNQDDTKYKRMHYGSAIHDDKLFLHGGFKPNDGIETIQKSFRYYDFLTDTFHQIETLSDARYHGLHSVINYGTKLYFIKGHDSSITGVTANVDIYDVADGTWSVITDTSGQNDTHTNVYGTDAYIYGGNAGTKFRKLDLLTDTFSALAEDSIVNRLYTITEEHDGAIYVIGGTYGSITYVEDLDVYDIIGDVVEYTSSATRGTYYLTATTNATGSLVATSKITIPEVLVDVTPENITIDQGQPYSFSAEVSNTANTDVTWSLVPLSHGTLDGAATSTSNPTEYLAPTIPGSSPTPLQNAVRVAVTTDDDSVSDYSAVTLRDVTTNINAETLTLDQGETYQFHTWIDGSVYPWGHEKTHTVAAWDVEDIIVSNKWYIYIPDQQYYLIYNFTNGAWSASATHATHTGNDSGVFTYNSRIHRYGGGYSANMNRVSRYIISTDTWSTDIDISGDIYRRRDYASVFYNNKFYIFGGLSSLDGTSLYATDHCFYYDPATFTVTDLSFKTPEPCGARAVLIGSVAYMAGIFHNKDGSIYFGLYSIDLASDTEWTRLDDAPFDFYNVSRMVVVGTSIYCTGPINDVVPSSDYSQYSDDYGQGAIYDTTDGSWYPMSRDTNIPKTESAFAYYSADSKIYSYGSARYGTDSLKDLRSYDLGNFSATWAIREGAGGGTITAAGLYTPGTTAGTYHIDVYTPADTTAVATCIVTVSAITIAVYPTAVTLGQRQQYLFTADVDGTVDTDVIWSVQAGGVGGTINNEGVYQAPQTAGTDTIVATSVADGAKTATAEVTVRSVTAQVEPSTSVMLASGTQQFRCAVQGNNDKSVTWSAPAGGSISVDGLFTAPVSAGTYTVRATTTVGSIVAEATVNVVADVYWENRIGLLLAANPFELCGIAEFLQPIVYRAALAKTLAKALGGEGVHGGGAKQFSLLGPNRGSGAVNKTKYPPCTLIIYDENKEAWFFRISASKDITFSDIDAVSSNLFAVATTESGLGSDFIKGAISDVSFIAQDADTVYPENSILLGTGTVVSSEFTSFTANYDAFIEDVISLFTVADTAATTETFESGELFFIEGGDGVTVEILTETVSGATVNNVDVNVDLASLSGLEFDQTGGLKVKIKNGDGILINTLDHAADGSLFANLLTNYSGYIVTNDGTLLLQNGDDLTFTGVDAVDTVVASDEEGVFILTVSLKDTIESQHDWMVAQTINSFFDIKGGLAIGSYVISPTDFSGDRELIIPDPGNNEQFINTSGPYLLAHIDLTGDVNILSDATETAIEWNEVASNVNWENSSMFDAGSPDQVNLIYPGIYMIIGQVQFEENSSDAGTRELRIEINGGTSPDGFGTKKFVSGKTCTLQAHSVIMVDENDTSATTIKLKAYQNSGEDVYLGDTGWLAVVRLSVKSTT